MLAIDLGGTRIKAARVVGGAVGEPVVKEHDACDIHGALAVVAEAITHLAPDGDDAVGLCVPGLVDDAGRVTALPGKLEGIVGFDLIGWLQERTGGRAVVVNDAIAYGLGAAGTHPGRTVVVTIGTGVGTAVVEDGRPLGRGALGGGLLGGQLPLTGDGPTDTSGRHGTIEAWCRADRLLAEVRAAGCDAGDVPAAYDAAAAGDDAALVGLATYRSWLARAVAALALAYTPETVLIGGGPVRADGLLLEGVEALVLPLLWPGQSVSVRRSEHGDLAALVGLSMLVEGSQTA